jgi:dTMP kinase
MDRGKFIAFCGGEGVGKSTQIRLLAEHLGRHGVDALVTREPGGTEEGRRLRSLLLDRGGPKWEPAAEALLMVADRVQHLARVVRPALAAGRHVVSDRYAFSTLAYQGGGHGVSVSFLRELHRTACGDLWPDLTLLLDLDPADGVARSRGRLAAEGSAEDRFEGLGLDFHRRVRAAFLELAAGAPAPTVVLDAARPVEALAAEIRDLVDRLIRQAS